MELNEISGRIIAAALKVHAAIGAGVLERVFIRPAWLMS